MKNICASTVDVLPRKAKSLISIFKMLLNQLNALYNRKFQWEFPNHF